MSEAMRAEALKYGQQAQQIFDLLRGNDNAQAQIRAPIYEEKVVDLILGRAKVSDKRVGKDKLLADDDMPEGYGAHDHDHDHDQDGHGHGKAPAKTAKPKTPKAKTAKAKSAAKAEEPVAEPAPAKAVADAVPPAKKRAAKKK
jgi:trigger factor